MYKVFLRANGIIAQGDNLKQEEKYNEALSKYSEGLDLLQMCENMNQGVVELKEMIAKLIFGIGGIHEYYGRTQDALKYYHNSLDYFLKLSLMTNTSNYDEDIITIQGYCAKCLRVLGRIEETISHCEKFAIFGNKILRNEPENVLIIYQLALLYERCGESYHTIGDYPTSLLRYNESIKLFNKLDTHNESDLQLQSALACFYFNLGSCYGKLGNHSEAIKAYEESIRIYKIGEKCKPKSMIVKISLAKLDFMLAGSFADNSCFTEAIDKYLESIKRINDILILDPNNYDLKRELGVVLMNLGSIHQNHGRLEECSTKYDEARNILENLSSQFPSDTNYQKHLQLLRENTELLEERKKIFQLPNVTFTFEP